MMSTHDKIGIARSRYKAAKRYFRCSENTAQRIKRRSVCDYAWVQLALAKGTHPAVILDDYPHFARYLPDER